MNIRNKLVQRVLENIKNNDDGDTIEGDILKRISICR